MNIDYKKYTKQELIELVQNLEKKASNKSIKVKTSIDNLESRNKDLKTQNTDLKDSEHLLKERIKEMNCLYTLSKSIVKNDKIEAIIQDLIAAIPPAWHYPEITVAQVSLNENTYTSPGFKETPWLLSSDIKINKTKIGRIDVYYTQEMPIIDEGPFLKEERTLLDSLSDSIGLVFNKIQINENLTAFQQQLSASNQQLDAFNQQLKATNQQLEAANQQLIASEEQNQKNLERYMSLMDGIEDAIYVADPITFEIIHVNDTAQKFWGKDIIGKKCYKILHNRDEPCPFCTNDIIFNKKPGETHVWEFQNEVTKQWFRCADKTINWPDGRKLRFELASEITELKDLSENLTIANQKLNATQQHLSANNQQLDASNQKLEANTQQLSAANQQLRATNQQLKAHEQQIKASNQQLIQKQKELQKSEEKIRHILENSTNFFYTHTAKHEITYVSPNFEDFLGYSYEEILSDWTNFITDNPINERGVKITQKAIDTGIIQPPYNLELLKKNGDKIIVEVHEAPVVKNGKTTSIVGSLTDITDRFKAVQNLKKSEDFLSTMFDSIQDGIIVINTNYEIERTNKWLKENFGKSENLIGKKCHEVIFNKKDICDDCPAVNCIKSGKMQTQTKEIKTHDGKIKYYEYSSHPIKNKKGQVEKIINYIKDVSKSKQYQEEIEIREKHLKSLLDNPSGYVIYRNRFNRETNNIEVISVSPSFTDVLGVSEEDTFTFMKWFTYVHPDDVNSLMESSNRGMLPPFMFSEKFRIMHPKDGLKWLEVRAKGIPYKDDKNMIEFANGIILDITEQQIAQEKLRKNEQRLNNAEKIGKTGNIEWNVEEDTAIWSDGAYEILKLKKNNTPPNFITLQHLFNEESKNIMLEASRLAINHCKDYDITLTGNLPDGTIKNIRVIGVVEKENNKATRINAVVHDITEQKESELKLLKAKKRAEESDKLKSAFLANMSHEIRTPMNGILGFTELLKTPSLDKGLKEKYIDIIAKSGERLLNTVNDIIDISKIDSGQVKVEYTLIDIHDKISELFLFFKTQAETKGLNLEVINNSQDDSGELFCDKTKLQSILNNLINNAIKYTKEGSIKILYTLNSNKIEIKVKDTGIGIPLERQDAIFDRFVQADIKDSMAMQGSGLGLSICKSYVEMLGGSLTVESEVNLGSVFTVTIPRKQFSESATKDESKTIKNKIVINEDYKVLIVDDDRVSREYLSIILQEEIKNIKHAYNGQEAVDKAKEEKFDIIFMDMKMPLLDGYDAIKKIRSFDKNVYIIGQSAYAMIGDKQKALEAGCNDYIEKPITKDQVDSVLSQSNV